MNRVATAASLCCLILVGMAGCRTGPSKADADAYAIQRQHAMMDLIPPPPLPSTRHICWIERVEQDGAGVRIVFIAAAPGAPDPGGTHLELGATLAPANSGHDGCIISAERSGTGIGVRAQAHLYVPGVTPEPEVRTEWIAATPR